MKRFIKKYQYELFATAMTMVVLWQLLLPGYVILLDWPAGPLMNFKVTDVTSLMNLPVNFLLHSINFILPGWVIQKILMFSIFFFGFYLPLKVCRVLRTGNRAFAGQESKVHKVKSHPTMLPTSLKLRGIGKLRGIKKFAPSDNPESIKLGVVPYFISLLNVFNPFVYERFLAGQWRVVVGYLSVLPLLIFLLEFQKEDSWKNAGKVFLTLFLTGLFSIHFLAIDAIVIFVFIVWQILFSGSAWLKSQIIIDENKQKKKNFSWLLKILGIGLIFLIFSSYWIVPFVLKRGDTVLNNFDASHQRAFATAQSENWSVTKNVIIMHGFWGEDHIWVNRFILPKNTKLFQIVFIIMVFFALLGLVFLLKNKRSRQGGIFLLTLLFLSIIFSAGTRNNPGQEINAWLFNNIAFWKGFRDSQKWSGVVVAIYILLAGKGVRSLESKICKVVKFIKPKAKSQESVKFINWSVLILPILLVPQMLFDFNGQIKTAWYPKEWEKINIYLSRQKKCRALFLPWHQYYPTKFSGNGLSYNLARNYFNCEVIVGHNTELWGIKPIVENIMKYNQIETAVTSNNPSDESVADVLKILKQNNIEYIIWTDDLQESDLYKYPFLQDDKLKRVIQTKKVVLYKII